MNPTTCLDEPADEALRPVAPAQREDAMGDDPETPEEKSGLAGVVVSLREWLTKRLPLDPPLE